jgi:hypothetical protein
MNSAEASPSTTTLEAKSHSEAEFLDVIGPKVVRVFLFTVSS